MYIVMTNWGGKNYNRIEEDSIYGADAHPICSAYS